MLSVGRRRHEWQYEYNKEKLLQNTVRLKCGQTTKTITEKQKERMEGRNKGNRAV